MTDDFPQQWRSKGSCQLADQGHRESGGPREWRSTGGTGGVGSSRSRGAGRAADNTSQCVDQDAQRDDGLSQGLEDKLGPLIRELKQLNPRVSMRELREL